MRDRIFVSGIGTEVGKTAVSIALCRKFGFDYWKPVQCGELENSDSHKLERYCPDITVFPEAHRLPDPLSPHHAARLNGVTINPADLHFPKPSGKLLIEGAGGLMVPLTTDYTFSDFAEEHRLPTVLVVRHYLGSINHTLLSLDHIKNKGIDLLGIVVSGKAYPEAEEMFKNRIIGRLEEFSDMAGISEKFVFYGLD